MSIRYKILLILLSLALSTHIIITSAYYYYSQETVKKEAVGHLEAMANVQKQRLNTFLDTNLEKLRLINSRTQLRRSLKQYNQTHDNESLKLMTKILSDAILNTRSIEDIFIIGLDGETITSVHEKHPHHSHKDHPLFLNAKEQPTVNYFVDEEDMDSTKILFSAPLKLDEELLGVIVMQVRTDALNEYLRDYTGLGLSGEVLMALDYNDKEMLFFTPLRFKQSPILVKKSSKTAEPMMLALHQKESTLENVLDYRGERVVAATRYLERLGFGIVVKMDMAEVLVASHDLKEMILELIIGLLLIVMIGSILIANQITKPVIDITEVAMMISHGNFAARVKKMTHDELGQLADAVNDMADKLIQSNILLESKVKERTKELREVNQQLEKLSQTDALTGLVNRGKFDTHLEESLRRSKRYQKPISLLILDLDHFKAVNDYYGHQQGDEYLRKVASVLGSIVERVDDLPARYGGEEFALILEDTDVKGAVFVAENIRQRIIDLKLENLHSKVEQYLTVSIGVATAVPDMEMGTADLIQKADVALYQAKKSGRNRVISND